MNELQTFKNDEFGQIRTIETEESEIWFVARDVCESLGFGNPRQAISSHVDPDDKDVHILDTLGGRQETTVINESGLYSLILGSRLPNAKKFKRWVTSEVLPSIRKTGGYHLPQTYSEALRELAEQAGLTEICFYDGYTKNPVTERSERIVMTARECGKSAELRKNQVTSE